MHPETPDNCRLATAVQFMPLDMALRIGRTYSDLSKWGREEYRARYRVRADACFARVSELEQGLNIASGRVES